MATKKIVEVSDGRTVYGTFSSEAKAKQFRKELKAKGIPTKMYIELVDTPKDAEKPKKAKTPRKEPATAKKQTSEKKAEPRKAEAATGKRFEPPGWKGSVLSADEIMESFRQPTECILLDNGWSYSIRMVPGKGGKVRLLLSEEGGQDVVPAAFDPRQLECDGRYLAIRDKSTTWWYEIRRPAPGRKAAPKRSSPPTPRDRFDDIDLSTCSIHDLARFLYVVQETCINHRVWNDGSPKGKPNPVYSAVEIESILSNPVLAPELCRTYLSCYITQFGQGWGGWDDSIVSYTDWKKAEARLNSIKDSIMKAVKNGSDKPKRKAAAPRKKAQSKKRTSGRRSAEIDEESIAGSIRAGIRKGCAKEGMDERDFTTILERSGCSLHTVVEGPDGVKALISIIHGDKGYSYEIVDPRSKLDSSGHGISEGDIPKVIEDLAGSVVFMIRTEIERQSTMKRKSPAGKGPDVPSQNARGIAEDLFWGRTSTGKNGFLEDAYIEGKEGVYQLCVEMVRSDEDSEWTVSVQRGAMIVERPRQIRTKDADARETVRLCRVRAVEAFLRHDVFVLEASKKEYERSFRDRKDGDDGKKKPVKKTKPRNQAASKGQYSASYYERLERDLRRAEKEGDNDAIIAITREIAESMSAEGDEIPDAKAYLEDSDYDELARNPRWKYDSRELNRRFCRR